MFLPSAAGRLHYRSHHILPLLLYTICVCLCVCDCLCATVKYIIHATIFLSCQWGLYVVHLLVFVCSHVSSRCRFMEKQVVFVWSSQQPDTEESQQTAIQVTCLNLLWLTPLRITTSLAPRQRDGWKSDSTSAVRNCRWRIEIREMSPCRFLICALILHPSLWPLKGQRFCMHWVSLRSAPLIFKNIFHFV